MLVVGCIIKLRAQTSSKQPLKLVLQATLLPMSRSSSGIIQVRAGKVEPLRERERERLETKEREGLESALDYRCL